MYMGEIVYSIYRGLTRTSKMLRVTLVLLLAASALSAPSYYEYASIEGTEDLGIAKNIGRANHLTDFITNIVDNGEASFYFLSLQNVLNDIATSPSRGQQAFAVANALGAIVPLATGVAGTACSDARVINAYAAGNKKQAVSQYINNLANNLELVVRLVQNPQAARFSAGPSSRCEADGRVYQFEAVWDRILKNHPNNGYVNEQYCTAKRLYNAFDVKQNNVAASVTASSIPEVVEVLGNVYGQVVAFVQALGGNGGNLNQALNQLQRALQKY